LNIVFDLGGVVVRWEPDVLIASVFDDPATRKAVRRHLIDHDDWLALDRGTLTPVEAAGRASARTGLAVEVIARFLERVPPALTPIPQTLDLLAQLKHRGHRLFCLSNMQFASIEHLERTYSFFELFDGAVISCRIKAIKPEPAIYDHLLASQAILPQETVFIDDIETNLVTAARFGIRTIQFATAAQCEQELRRLGCL
jgi:putative hydrolase of the HAD superfamily